MPPRALTRPLVIHGEDATAGHVRTNPAVSALGFFKDFAAGYLVGTSIATHPAGEACGRHNHRGAVEMFLVLDGCGIIEVAGERHRVVADDCVVVPHGVDHNLIGIDREVPFRVLCVLVVAPGHGNDPTPWKPRGLTAAA